MSQIYLALTSGNYYHFGYIFYTDIDFYSFIGILDISPSK
jgi:hypothetical protein